MSNYINLDRNIQQRIYEVVRLIPSGQIATYGQIARIAGMAISARVVGYALAALTEGTDVPWQRVINAKGCISLPGIGGAMQQRLLLEEGVTFDEKGKVDLDRFGWEGPGSTDEGAPMVTSGKLTNE